MGVEFTVRERSALHRLMADTSNANIVIKSDARGFILCATPAIAQIGYDLSALLIGPHVRDLGHLNYAQAIEAAHHAALTGPDRSQWLEFPCPGDSGRQAWYEVRMRGLQDPRGRSYGVLSVLRCITERKRLEDRLFAAEMTDPLTRLTNRIAFTAMLDHMVTGRHEGSLALFDLDRFFALNLRYGPSACDNLICASADLLRAMTRREDIISRVDGERFALLMPDLSLDQAAELCQPIVEAFAAAGTPVLGKEFPVTITAGVSPILLSTDYTLKRAEIALLVAKSKGRSRVETGEEEWPRMLARCA